MSARVRVSEGSLAADLGFVLALGVGGYGVHALLPSVPALLRALHRAHGSIGCVFAVIIVVFFHVEALVILRPTAFHATEAVGVVVTRGRGEEEVAVCGGELEAAGAD